MDKNFFVSQFALGCYFASLFTILSLYHLFRVKGELARFRRHLSDKLEIEAETMKKMKAELETLRKENESLRVNVRQRFVEEGLENALNEQPERKIQRDLEIYARAERRMLINAPGFAPAWETAKNDAHNELSEEEAGKSQPKRGFLGLFGGRAQAQSALPVREEGKLAGEGGNGHKPE